MIEIAAMTGAVLSVAVQARGATVTGAMASGNVRTAIVVLAIVVLDPAALADIQVGRRRIRINHPHPAAHIISVADRDIFRAGQVTLRMSALGTPLTFTSFCTTTSAAAIRRPCGG